jgi:hypothetical protein
MFAGRSLACGSSRVSSHSVEPSAFGSLGDVFNVVLLACTTPAVCAHWHSSSVLLTIRV